MKKYILFDNDGVLVETEKWYFQANYDALKDMGIELSQERYLNIMIEGKSAFILAEEKGFDSLSIEKSKDKRNELYQDYIRTQDIEIKGVKDLISKLSKRYKMGIVTSSRREDFELIHKSTELTKHMHFVLCSGEYKRSKPFADPYLKGLDIFGAKKEESIVVEDSQRGLSSAYNAGIDCVIVHNDFTIHHDFSKAQYFINTLAELEDLL
ncbi:HAD family phosphatase [Sulfurimonas sp. MAG313]|nr:HAD family phosphatase [Sulfurimonas sp. MAG313]MDF1881668.1 HAD family phosphatase [Sulfurimonas sp. MAG313]